MAEHGIEAHVIFFFQNIQVAVFCSKVLFDCALGFPKAYPRTFNGERYHGRKCKLLLLRNELRSAIRTNWRGSLSHGVVLLHDNGRPHTAHLTLNTTGQLNSEVLGHPAHSPKLGLSDFHPFGPLKNALRRRRFVDDDEVKEAAHESFVTKKIFFFILQWHQEGRIRWAPWIEKKRDYIEK